MIRFLAAFLCLLPAGLVSAQTTYSFGVLPQRSAVLSAQYWNPILDYVTRKTGVTLELGTRRTALEYSEAEARGEFDFVYSNHILAPGHDDAAYRVIARIAGDPIRSQIVVPQSSTVKALGELEGREVGFANRNAFAGYAAPMAALIGAGVRVVPVFGGNQEGVMAQLRAGAVPAAGVNSRVMKEYAARERYAYRAIWTSEPYQNLPVAAHPRVPPAVVRAVQDALLGMATNAEGARILAASAAVIKQERPWGFVPALDAEYANQREVYRVTWKAEVR